MAIKRILVPVDYSDCSRAALEYAADLATSFGATLDVVHVWDRPTYVSDALLVHQPQGKPRSLLDLIRENAEHDMSEFLQGLRLPQKVSMSRRLISGDPASALLDELEKREHDLAVMGTHGRTGLSHFVLGSVAEKLVRMSPVPVLSVPRPGS